MKKLKPKAVLKQYMAEALAAAPHASPRCPHFAECGGCEYQDYPYAVQIAAKRATWARLAADAGLELPPAEMVASPREYGYRQRMDYVYAFNAAGLRQRGSHRRVVELQQCPLLGDRGFAAFRRARELAAAAGLSWHDYLHHDGFLRYFVVRRTRSCDANPESGRLGGILLSLVTYSDGFADEIARIAETLLAENLVTSVYWLVNSTLSDLSFGEVRRFWGAEHIRETYQGMDFLIGPNTFAQANPDVAELAYGRIVAANRGEAHVCDAYSGTGAIGQLLAPHCGAVTAVENVPDNVELARTHAAMHGVDNVRNVLADAQDFLRRTAEEAASGVPAPFTAMVVNPPRSGVGEKAARALVAIATPRITYMSCNPQTLVTDLKILTTAYTVEKVTLFDMFPQTHHWETLVQLVRKNP